MCRGLGMAAGHFCDLTHHHLNTMIVDAYIIAGGSVVYWLWCWTFDSTVVGLISGSRDK